MTDTATQGNIIAAAKRHAAGSRLSATPWARAAIGGEVAMRRLRQRVPTGCTLALSGRSARGPWHVSLILPGGHVAAPRYDQPDLSRAVDAVLAAAGVPS